MRILFLITKAEVGGAQSHVLELVKGLLARHEVLVAAGDEGPLLAECRSAGAGTRVIRHLVHPIRPVADLLATAEVCGLAKAFGADLIHAHSSKAGIVGRVAAAAMGIPAVFTAHGWAFTEGAPRGRRLLALALERACARLSSAIIAVSRYDHELALRFGVGTDRLFVIHNGIACGPSPRRRAARRDGGVVIAMTARFAPPKDQALVLRALARLPEHVRAVFVGAGQGLDACKAQARALGLAHRVSFAGERADVDAFLQEADIFVLASDYEGLPISIMEAMRAGLPVVASDVGGIPELVEHGRTGLLVRKGSAEDLAVALQELVLLPEAREQMGRRGRARFEAAFSSARMLRATEAIYEAALAGSAAALAATYDAGR